MNLCISWRPRLLFFSMVAWLGLGAAGGCEDVDWDWEGRWWQRQQRQVQPDRTVRADSRRDAPAPAAPTATETLPPSESPGGTQTLASSEPVQPVPVVASTDPVQPAPPRPEPPPPPAPAPPVRTMSETSRVQTPPPAPRVDALPASAGDGFFQVYLSSDAESARPGSIVLKHAPARIVAQIVAQLYLPIGLGGGEDQHYLIYQDVAENQAARGVVPLVDAAPGADPGGSQSELVRAMRMLILITQAGAAPPRESVQECRAILQRAVVGPDLEARSRWVAAMLSGRLASEQLFDYEAARLAYDEAAAHAAPGSVEMLATLWARAESYELGGDRAAARREYERITKDFAGGHPRAQAVQRAAAAATAKRR